MRKPERSSRSGFPMSHLAARLSVLVLAGLVSDAAACLACALAGCLAFAAAARNSTLCHITCVKSNDVLH